MIFQHEIRVSTRNHGEMHDLTNEVQRIIGELKIATGVVNVSVIGSTAAISTIEFEPGLERDFRSFSTGLFRQVAVMATSRRGMMAMAIRIFRRRSSVQA